MPYYVVNKTMEALNNIGKSIKGAKILVLGAAYKKDVDDLRESPSLKIITLLQDKGAIVDYNDPYIPEIPPLRKYSLKMHSVELTEENLKSYDALVIVTDHSVYDPTVILKNANLIIDTRNLIKAKDPKVVKA
jgi:UDP-N-acetyl-D-glucosamine dehydrogenase